ncbi:MAG: M50 family metallopeptidase [Bacteroidales bacterium]
MIHQPPYYWFYLILLLAAIVPRIPFLGKYFQVFNTLIHENGHALMSLLTRGSIHKIELFYDTSGTAYTSSRYKVSHFLTSLAGYPASAGAALLLFFLLNTKNEFFLMIALAGILGLNLILFVRNLYGIIWILTFGSLVFLLFYIDNTLAMEIAIIFFGGILFWGSLMAPLNLIRIAWHEPKQAGDASNLNKITGIPSLLWSLIFFFISLFIAWHTIQQFPMAEEYLNKLKAFIL